MHSLEERIGYTFRNRHLLTEALTHPSVRHESRRQHFDNQRLEFLGDAVLQLIFTEHLFHLFPNFDEGALTKLRSRVVSRDAFKKNATHLGLGKLLVMGKGEEASGGRQRVSALADSFEALVGAIYLDSDFETARNFVIKEAAEQIAQLKRRPVDENPKGRLQEILQALSPKGPTYRIVSESGPEHQKYFVAKVMWNGVQLGAGEGASKKLAQIAAAAHALKQGLWEQK